MDSIQKYDEQEVLNVGQSKIKIVYQRFGDPALPPVFLIMGGAILPVNMAL